jgi:uncharacterized protein YecT (DUF1311 family)
MRKYLLPILLLLPTLAYGQETNVHPIDKFLDACTNKDPSTAGVLKCTDAAYQKWDQELNKNYVALMDKLKPAGKQALKSAQLAWLKYRDAEFQNIDGIYGSLEGTMYIPMHEYRRISVIKERALSLVHYLNLINEAGPR